MTCSLIDGGGVVYCAWGRPTKSDMDQLLHRIEKAFAETGDKVLYVSRVPTDAPAPEPEARAYLNSLMPRITPMLHSCHIVLEGTGFVAAMKRAVLLSLFQINKHRSRFFVYASFSELERRVSDEWTGALRKVLRDADAHGVLMCGSLPSKRPTSSKRDAGRFLSNG